MSNSLSGRSGPSIFAILFASFTYAILSAVVKKELSHLSVPGILFWRYAVCLLLFLPWMILQRQGQNIDLKPKSIRLYWVRMIVSFAGIYLYCESLKTISIGIASLFFNLLPLYIPFIAYLWDKTAIRRVLWWGIGVTMLGLMLVLSSHEIQWDGKMLLALVSGMCGAFGIVFLHFTHNQESTYRKDFYFYLLSFAITVPLSWMDVDKSWKALSIDDLFPLFLIGLMGFLYQQSFSFAMKKASASLLAPFLCSTVIWGMLLDHWMWGVQLTIVMWVGVGFIILGHTLNHLLYSQGHQS